jgi:hypothetical protein
MRTKRLLIVVCLSMVLALTMFSMRGMLAAGEKIRWDFINNMLEDDKPTTSEGGIDFATAIDGSYLVVKGTGTFGPGVSDPVTGGGDWMTFDVTNAKTAGGKYTVTGLVSWTEGSGTLPDALVDKIGDKATFRAGVAVLTVTYTNDDGSAAGDGVLIISCHGPVGGTDTTFEGFVGTMGAATFYDATPARPGVNANRTQFHVVS